MQEGGAAAVDADDEDRPHNLLASDLRVLPAFTGQLGVVAQEPAQLEDNVTETVLQQSGTGRIHGPDQSPQGLAHPGRASRVEGDASVSSVALAPAKKAVGVQAAPCNRVGPFLPMRQNPFLGAPELGPRARPLDRVRTVLPDGAVADGQPVHRLVPAEPVCPQMIEHGPVTVERRTLAARLAGALERLVGNFGPVEPEIGGLQIVVFQIRVAAVVDGEPAFWIQRNCGTDPAQRIDRFVARAKREPLRQRLAVDRRRKRPHTQIVRRGIPRAGQADLRQPKDRQRHAGLLRKQENLFGCQLAPRVAEQPDRKRLLHACEVRLHLVVDAAVLELMRKCAEILGEHAHGRGEEQVLEANAQAQFDHVANAERIVLANVEIGRREIDVGGKVIDGVDLPAQRIELLDGKTESRLADVADHDVDA